MVCGEGTLMLCSKSTRTSSPASVFVLMISATQRVTTAMAGV